MSGEDPVDDSGEPAPGLTAQEGAYYGLDGLAGPNDKQESLQRELDGPGGKASGVEGGIGDDGEEEQGDAPPSFHPALGPGEEPAALFEEFSSFIAYGVAGDFPEGRGEASYQADKEGIEPGTCSDNYEAAGAGQEDGGSAQESEDEYADIAEGDKVLFVEQVIVEKEGADAEHNGGNGRTQDEMLTRDASPQEKQTHAGEQAVAGRSWRVYF